MQAVQASSPWRVRPSSKVGWRHCGQTVASTFSTSGSHTHSSSAGRGDRPRRGGHAGADQQLGLVDLDQRLISRRWTFNWLFCRSSATRSCSSRSEGLEPPLEAGEVLAPALRPADLLLDLGSQVAVVAVDAFELAGQPLAPARGGGCWPGPRGSGRCGPAPIG